MKTMHRYELNKIYTKILMKIVWLLSKGIVYWCYIRVHSYATSHRYSNKTPDEITCSMALEEWENVNDNKLTSRKS